MHFITVFSGLYANVTEVRIKQLHVWFYILYFIVLSIILTILIYYNSKNSVLKMVIDEPTNI